LYKPREEEEGMRKERARDEARTGIGGRAFLNLRDRASSNVAKDLDVRVFDLETLEAHQLQLWHELVQKHCSQKGSTDAHEAVER